MLFRALLSLIVVAFGVALGSWAGTPDAIQPAGTVLRKGAGELLVEYFDPACAGSRSAHLRLEKLATKKFIQWMVVPVAIARGSKPTLADALCASKDDTAWRLAATWSHSPQPPAFPELANVDRNTLQACAQLVEAATIRLGSISRRSEILTPMAEFRGRVYVGSTAIDELLALLEGIPNLTQDAADLSADAIR